MNNTNTITGKNTTVRLTALGALTEAKRLAGQYGLPAFVYQTGPDSYNYRFVSEEPACGVLVARFDKTGKSC